MDILITFLLVSFVVIIEWLFMKWVIYQMNKGNTLAALVWIYGVLLPPVITYLIFLFLIGV